MTFRGALEEARALASRAEALAEERARVAGEQGGLGADADPVKIIPQAIEHLNSEEPARRVFGAQLLCEVKVARHPLAQSARAELERARASNDPDLAGFAAMALRRLDYFKLRRASTPRS
jgi:hypothetical protein